MLYVSNAFISTGRLYVHIEAAYATQSCGLGRVVLDTMVQFGFRRLVRYTTLVKSWRTLAESVGRRVSSRSYWILGLKH